MAISIGSDGQPAARSDFLAEQRHRQGDHEQRRGGGNRMHVGEGEVFEGQHEDAVLGHQHGRTQALERGLTALPDATDALAAQHDEGQRREDDVAHPEDLRDAQGIRQHLSDAVHGSEGQHGNERECYAGPRR
jgi:hypothetical protein